MMVKKVQPNCNMSNTSNDIWFLSEKTPSSTYGELLAGLFHVKAEQHSATQKIEILDDFDWHIWQSGKLLLKQNQSYCLQQPESPPLQFEQAGDPKFSWEFAEHEASGVLAPLIGVRALQTVFSCNHSDTCWEVRNFEDDKLVCRIREVWLQGDHDVPFCSGYLKLEALRGYQREYQQIVAKFQEHFVAEPTSEPIDLRLLLKHHHFDDEIPAAITAEINYHLPSEAAVRLLLKALLLDSRRHVDGICRDIDSEYLHDFRVQIRKARSLVQLLKKSFSADDQLQIKTLLADIARPTGPLRDLDVFLLEQNRYRELLPQEQHAGFEVLLRNIKNARAQAFKKVNAYLSNSSYISDFEKVLALVDQPAHCDSPEAQRAVGEYVAQLIAKRYRKICKMGLSLDDNTPDEAVHSLRIECKKLRYLLTLFGSLFASGPLKKIIKRMKGLQSVLGDFNDFTVQQSFLNEQASRSRSQNLIITVSGLVAVLHQKQLEVRAHVCDGMSEFAAPETASLIEQLLLNEAE